MAWLGLDELPKIIILWCWPLVGMVSPHGLSSSRRSVEAALPDCLWAGRDSESYKASGDHKIMSAIFCWPQHVTSMSSDIKEWRNRSHLLMEVAIKSQCERVEGRDLWPFCFAICHSILVCGAGRKDTSSISRRQQFAWLTETWT